MSNIIKWFDDQPAIKKTDFNILAGLRYQTIENTLRFDNNSISYNYIYAMCLIGGPIFIKISQNISNKIEINNELSTSIN